MTPTPNGSAWSELDFDARLQQLLDERRDPLDDPQLVAWLDDHPERLAAFAALRDDLQHLGSRARTQEARAPTSSRRARLGAAAVAVAAALVLVFALRETTRTAEQTQTEQHSPGRVLTAHLEGHPPRLYATADFTLHESLWQTPRLDFTTSHRIHVTR